MIFGVTPASGTFPGVSAVFQNGQAVSDQFKHIYLHDLPTIPPDATLIIGAWSAAYSLPLRRHQGPKYILWTSPPLQSELAGVEMDYLQTVLGLKEKGVIKDVLWNDSGFAEAMGGVHFPHPYVLPESSKVPQEARSGAALFAPAHPRKNVVTQALAAKLAGLQLHLNGADQYHGILKALKVDFVDHGWMETRADYLGRLGRCKISLGVFLSESHGYSIHDSLALGVPVVASGCVADNFGFDDIDTVVPVDDPVAICERILSILQEYEWACKRARAYAEHTAAGENKAFSELLKTLEAP